MEDLSRDTPCDAHLFRIRHNPMYHLNKFNENAAMATNVLTNADEDKRLLDNTNRGTSNMKHSLRKQR